MLSVINDRAIFIIKSGSPVLFDASSRANLTKLEYGLSKTAHAISEFYAQYINAVTAPIDLPHRHILENFYDFFKYSTTTSTSYISNHPKDIYSPSEFPEPLISIEQNP